MRTIPVLSRRSPNPCHGTIAGGRTDTSVRRRPGRLLAGASLAAVMALSACSVGAPDGGSAEYAVDADQAAPDSEPVPTDQDNLSTFAVDIDTASYEYARQAITNGWLPESENIRPRSSSTTSGRTTPNPPTTVSP